MLVVVSLRAPYMVATRVRGERSSAHEVRPLEYQSRGFTEILRKDGQTEKLMEDDKNIVNSRSIGKCVLVCAITRLSSDCSLIRV